MTIVLIIFALMLVYAGWLLMLAIAWILHVREEQKNSAAMPVTIIVPCRNEADHIRDCIKSILSQNYPKDMIELIIVDDHSDDATASLVDNEPDCRLLRLPEGKSGKKAALAFAIAGASHELIITRDADTVSDKNWLQHIVNEFTVSNADMIICPVTLKAQGSLLNVFERLEYYAFTVMTGATSFIGKPILCNGANLAFRKSAFERVNGYAGNDDLASGDDVFLMNKIVKDNGRIRYLKSREATVFTDTTGSLKGMISQRLRWAGKNTRNTNFLNIFSGLVVFFSNISWLLMAVLSLFYTEWAGYFVIITALKCIIDFLLLFLGATFHRQGTALFAFPLMVLLYPLYIALLAILSVFIKPVWKGRTIK